MLVSHMHFQSTLFMPQISTEDETFPKTVQFGFQPAEFGEEQDITYPTTKIFQMYSFILVLTYNNPLS